MLSIRYLLFSRDVSVDEVTKNFSVHNIIEQINAPQFPASLNEAVISVLFTRDPNDQPDHICKLSICKDEVEKYKQEFTVQFKDALRTRAIVRMNAITIANPGTLKILIYNSKDEIIQELKLDVVLLPAIKKTAPKKKVAPKKTN